MYNSKSQTPREADHKDLHIHGSQSMLDAVLRVQGKSDDTKKHYETLDPMQDHSPRICPSAHPHLILTRLSPNLPQSVTLPSHLNSSPLHPQPNTCHHLLTSSSSKTTATTVRDKTLIATDGQSNHSQRQTN